MANANLQAWRSTRTQMLDLPSGLTVTVKRVSLVDLAAAGQIPAPLLGTVERLVNEASAGGQMKVKIEDMADFGGILEALARAAVVEPALADQPDEDHLGIGELDMPDKLAIFEWANAEAATLKPFRGGSAQSLAAASPGGGLRSTAQRAAGGAG